MTKLAITTLIPPSCSPSSPLESLSLSEQEAPALFLRSIAKVAGITYKDFVYELRVSKTLVDGWHSGIRRDPLEQAKRVCQMLVKRKRMDLIVAVLAYIAGGDDADCCVLTAEQFEALKVLAKVIK